MSMIGKEVQEFSLQAYNPKTEEFFEVTEADFKDKWTIVIFYPADFSFVCPTELEDMQEQYATIQELGGDVYAVSTDTHFVHKAWHEHSDAINSLEYSMIGDPSAKLVSMFDVLDEEAGLAQRGTFIVDPDGVIQAEEVNADGIGRDASSMIPKLRAAQYVRDNPNEVCPAKWKETQETLTPGIDLVGKI